MNALEILKADHEKVRKILADIESTTDRGIKKREKLFFKLKEELQLHEKLEEKLFYPMLKENDESRPLALEAYEEHHLVNNILAEMQPLDFADEIWLAKFSVLKENLNHHIKEEEKDIFKITRKLFDRTTLIELGKKMSQFKKGKLEI